MIFGQRKSTFEKKVAVVEAYMRNGKSLRTLSKETGIANQTIWEWIKKYKEYGKEGLRRKKKCPRKLPKALEVHIMMLKEQNPSLSIANAQHLLEHRGIVLARRQIWQIWRKYNIACWHTQDLFKQFCDATPESAESIKRARMYLCNGDRRSAAKILNELPCMPEDTILREIPERYLSPRRKLDQLVFEMGNVPFKEYVRKARRVRKTLESKGYMRSSIIAHVGELLAITWLGKPNEALVVLQQLYEKLKHIHSSTLWFHYYFYLAMTYCQLLQLKRAVALVKKCRRLLYSLPSSTYQDDFGSLLSWLGKYKEAAIFHARAWKNEDDAVSAERMAFKMVYAGPVAAGEYRAAQKLLLKVQGVRNTAGFTAHYSDAQASIAFGQGNLAQATHFLHEALEKATKGELLNVVYATSVGLAAVALALNNTHEAKIHLRKYLPLMRKSRMLREELVLNQLLGAEALIPDELLQIPQLRLLSLLVRANRTLKIYDYRKAYDFAKRQRLLGILDWWSVFFSKPIIRVLEKGKRTGLPRALLKFPAFNQYAPVYHIKLLGTFIILRQHSHLTIKLTPKEKAFMTHLALRTSAPGKFVVINELYHNYWTTSEHPSDLLLHLLAKIKRKLMLPGHLLSISSMYGEPRLINRGIYFTTDYDEFKTLVAQAASLERADQWSFALRDYLRALKLLRGEPFRKMYDPWSEQMRAVILNTMNETLKSFVQGCINHNNKKEAQRVVTRISTFLPISEELRHLMKDITQ